jgi:hypothetical protein
MASASAACAEEATDAASKASPAVVKASRRVVGLVVMFWMRWKWALRRAA